MRRCSPHLQELRVLSSFDATIFNMWSPSSPGTGRENKGLNMRDVGQSGKSGVWRSKGKKVYQVGGVINCAK